MRCRGWLSFLILDIYRVSLESLSIPDKNILMAGKQIRVVQKHPDLIGSNFMGVN